MATYLKDFGGQGLSTQPNEMGAAAVSTKALTIIIPSYQRADALKRVLLALRDQLEDDRQLAEGTEVVVVLDGSSDGSEEMINELEFPGPVKVIWQPNRGLAASRNAGIAAAGGEIVWLLDDDGVPSAGAVRRHLMSHQAGPPHLTVGPCLIPRGWNVPEEERRQWAEHFDRLEEQGAIMYFYEFTAANTSGPREIFLQSGGFNEDFRAYGAEDWELGVRLLAARIPIVFDRGALVWHLKKTSWGGLCSAFYQAARNHVRLIRLHPETLSALISRQKAARLYWLINLLKIRSPGVFLSLSKIALGLAWLERMATRGRSCRTLLVATALSYCAGISAEDHEGELLRAFLGGPLNLGDPQNRTES